ncbi:hypothetical protein RRG08_031653 [Elysia crispata]|uniref:Uncharacterized protein n=1 Tax=Elysia crispata TaxID=231223 RepID=A0AAE1D725_9GAST|nr:hypothetical protein RRG08_031653 [Elysia crispata]
MERGVEFNVVKGRKGVTEINVTGPRGANVVGSRYAAIIDELNPRHHASSLGGNRQRRNKRCVGVEDYQSSARPGGGSRVCVVVADSFSVIKTISQDNHGREYPATNQGSPYSALIVVALGTTIAKDIPQMLPADSNI